MSLSGLLGKADALVEQGNLVKALEVYKEAVKVARRKKQVDEEVLIAYNNMLTLHLRLMSSREDLIQAKNYALEFVKVAKRSERHSDMYAVACFITGLIMLALNDYRGAVRYLEDAVIVFEIIDHKEGLMLASKNLADTYNALSYKNKAYIYANRARAIAKELGDTQSLKEVDRILREWRGVPWVIKK